MYINILDTFECSKSSDITINALNLLHSSCVCNVFTASPKKLIDLFNRKMSSSFQRCLPPKTRAITLWSTGHVRPGSCVHTRKSQRTKGEKKSNTRLKKITSSIFGTLLGDLQLSGFMCIVPQDETNRRLCQELVPRKRVSEICDEHPGGTETNASKEGHGEPSLILQELCFVYSMIKV